MSQNNGELGRQAGGAEILRGENLSKSYGAVTALVDVTVSVRRGEILGLIGDNGAGKTTLFKILTGYHEATAGKLMFMGEPVRYRSVAEARRFGIETVYQDLGLVDQLPAYRNVFLGREITRRVAGFPVVDRRAMREAARKHIADIGVQIRSVDATTGELSGGQRQAIAVARAMLSQPKVLLLDEPLAAMGAKEGSLIIALMKRLRARGDVAIVLIAHNYSQVLDICDRVNLLQHGSIALDKPTRDTSLDELNSLVLSGYSA